MQAHRAGSIRLGWFLTFPTRVLTGCEVIARSQGHNRSCPGLIGRGEDLGCHALDALILAAGDRRKDHHSEEPCSYLLRQAEHDRGDQQRGAAEIEECRT